MNEIEIKQALDELANLRAAHDALTLQKQALVDSIMTPEIRAKLADIDAEFLGKSAEADAKAATLEAEVRAAVLAHGATVKSTFYQAVWMKGKTSWDTTALSGYALAHPEILVLRKTGEPSVSLRSI